MCGVSLVSHGPAHATNAAAKQHRQESTDTNACTHKECTACRHTRRQATCDPMSCTLQQCGLHEGHHWGRKTCKKQFRSSDSIERSVGTIAHPSVSLKNSWEPENPTYQSAMRISSAVDESKCRYHFHGLDKSRVAEVEVEEGVVLHTVQSLDWLTTHLNSIALSGMCQGVYSGRSACRLEDWETAYWGEPVGVVHSSPLEGPAAMQDDGETQSDYQRGSHFFMAVASSFAVALSSDEPSATDASNLLQRDKMIRTRNEIIHFETRQQTGLSL